MSNPSANQSDENSVQRDQDQQAANSNSDSDYSSFEQSNDQDMNVDQCIFENDASEGDSADEKKSNLDDETDQTSLKMFGTKQFPNLNIHLRKTVIIILQIKNVFFKKN